MQKLFEKTNGDQNFIGALILVAIVLIICTLQNVCSECIREAIDSMLCF